MSHLNAQDEDKPLSDIIDKWLKEKDIHCINNNTNTGFYIFAGPYDLNPYNYYYASTPVINADERNNLHYFDANFIEKFITPLHDEIIDTKESIDKKTLEREVLHHLMHNSTNHSHLPDRSFLTSEIKSSVFSMPRNKIHIYSKQLSKICNLSADINNHTPGLSKDLLLKKFHDGEIGVLKQFNDPLNIIHKFISCQHADHSNQHNDSYFESKNLINPAKPLMELIKQYTNDDHLYIVLTWLIHSMMLDKEQIALEIVGDLEKGKLFAQKIINIFERGSSHNTLIEEAYHNHYVLNLNIESLDEATQEDIVRILKGSTQELSFLKLHNPPTEFIRRPVILTTKESVKKSDDLHQRTISINLASSSMNISGDNTVPQVYNYIFFECVLDILHFARNMDSRIAQRTSPDVPEPLKEFDQLGNFLSPTFFKENYFTPYTEFGYQMDALLPELGFSMKDDHDFY